MKLRLRDLFWFISLAALVTIWWLDHPQLAARLSGTKFPQPGAVPFRILPKADVDLRIRSNNLRLRNSKSFQQLQEEWEREWFDAPSHLEPRQVHGGVI